MYKAYRQSPKGREVQAKASAKYWRSEHGRSIRQAYLKRFYADGRGYQAHLRWRTSKAGYPVYLAAIKRARAKRRKVVRSTLKAAEWLEIRRRYKFRCAYCNLRRKLTQDHIIPISKGGDHTAENIAPACMSCNIKKRAQLWTPRLPKL